MLKVIEGYFSLDVSNICSNDFPLLSVYKVTLYDRAVERRNDLEIPFNFESGLNLRGFGALVQSFDLADRIIRLDSRLCLTTCASWQGAAD